MARHHSDESAIRILLIGTAPTSEAKSDVVISNSAPLWSSTNSTSFGWSFELIGTTVRPACHAPQSATR